MQKFYITTPIYYVNSDPHIGTLYTTLAADVVARFKELEGYEVKFVTGTDEHGQKVEEAATKAGMKPQEFVDMMAKKFDKLFKDMHIVNDDFIRTTEPRHKKAAIALWNELKEKGHIYKGEYSGWYSVRDESFYTEKELVDGKAPTGAEVEWISEESYFFDLSKWTKKLSAFYEEHPDFVVPEWRFREVKNILKADLPDLSISRDASKSNWGIPVPGDSKHVMYVWLDALANYISVLGYPDKNSKDFKTYWPADVHMLGKDIIKFHAVYWPAILMAADLPLPKKIVAHGWWTIKGEKMSKSIRNVVCPTELTEECGMCQVRYYLMREIPFGEDGGFSHDGLISRVNTELSNKIGNLFQRTLSIVYKDFDKKIPSFTKSELVALYEGEVLQGAQGLFEPVRVALEAFQFNQMLEFIVRFVDKLNIYVDTKAPWKLKKVDKKETERVLYVVLEALRYVSILLQPFIPVSAEVMLNQLKVSKKERTFACLNSEFALKGSTIDVPKVIFGKICKTL